MAETPEGFVEESGIQAGGEFDHSAARSQTGGSDVDRIGAAEEIEGESARRLSRAGTKQ